MSVNRNPDRRLSFNFSTQRSRLISFFTGGGINYLVARREVAIELSARLHTKGRHYLKAILYPLKIFYYCLSKSINYHLGFFMCW